MTTAILLDCDRHSNTRHGMRHVFLALAAYATPYGPHAQAFPSLTTIATKAHLSLRQTCRCLRRLQREGYIRIARCASRYGTNRYTLFRPWRMPAHLKSDKLRRYSENKEKQKKETGQRRWHIQEQPPQEPKRAKGERFLYYLGLTPGSEIFTTCQET